MRLATIDSADVARARNGLANMALADDSVTHILFVDSDMAIDTEVFRPFIAFDRAMVGAIFPERALDLECYAEERAAGRPG